MGNAKLFGCRLVCFIFLILFLPTGPAWASGAELTNLVIKNNREDLLIDLKINGVFTNEMRAALLNGIPVSFTFWVILSELIDKKYHFFSLPWEFETDWYTINFIY